MRSMRRMVAVMVLLGFGASGCFGRFALVNKLYDINKGVGNKWVQTIVFWVFVILPVYELASLGDALIFNLIEFWSGHNPLAMNDGPAQERVVQADGKKVTLSFADGGKSVLIRVEAPNEPARVYRLEGTEDGATLRDGSGHVLAQSGRDAEGALVVRDGSGEALMRRSGSEVAALGSAIEQGPAAFLAAETRRTGCGVLASTER